MESVIPSNWYTLDGGKAHPLPLPQYCTRLNYYFITFLLLKGAHVLESITKVFEDDDTALLSSSL